MGRIACAAVMVLVCATASSAQIENSKTAENQEQPSRKELPKFDGGLASMTETPAAESHAAVPMGTVSVNELRVPVAARKELSRFRQSLHNGNMQACVKHLTKALRVYPEMAAAHQNLGACYVRLNEYDKAIDEFQLASGMDKQMIQPARSLAGVYLVLKRFADAELQSRRALEIDSGDPIARYLLGRALAFEGRDTAETEGLLRESSSQYPDAHLALAGLFLKRNAEEDALTELRAYIQRPEVPEKYRDTIGCAIEKLTGAAQSVRCALVSSTPLAAN